MGVTAGAESPGRDEPNGDTPNYYAVSTHLLHDCDWWVHDGKGGTINLPWVAYTYFSALEPVGRAGYSILICMATPNALEGLRRAWRPTNKR
jgi:hypothetical protein